MTSLSRKTELYKSTGHIRFYCEGAHRTNMASERRSGRGRHPDSNSAVAGVGSAGGCGSLCAGRMQCPRFVGALSLQ